MHSLCIAACLLCVITAAVGRSVDYNLHSTYSTLEQQEAGEVAAIDFTSSLLRTADDALPNNPIDYQSTITAKLSGLYDAWSARGFTFAKLDFEATKDDVIAYPEKFSALVVVIAQGGTPQRRSASEPFLRTEPASLLPTTVINKAAGVVEGVLGRRLYPFTVKLVEFNRKNQASGWGGPYAVFDASTGEILVDSSLQGSWSSDEAQQSVKQVAGPLFDFIADNAAQLTAAGVGVEYLLQLLRNNWPFLIGAVVVAKVPLWFCALCPAILGLALPLLINGALGGIAHEVCTQFQMSDDQCLEMWYGAFALGFLLSMASAVPIFYVCKLYQCEHPNKAVGTFLSQVTRRLRF